MIDQAQHQAALALAMRIGVEEDRQIERNRGEYTRYIAGRERATDKEAYDRAYWGRK